MPKKSILPRPKNSKELLEYVNTYVRALKWNSAFSFPDCPQLSIHDTKVVLNTHKQVVLTFKVEYVTRTHNIYKEMKAVYSTKNYKSVREDILHVYRQVKNQQIFRSRFDKKKFEALKLEEKGWVVLA